MLLIIRFLPFCLALGAGFLVTSSTIMLGDAGKFVLVTSYVLFAEYICNWWNVKRMRVEIADQGRFSRLMESKFVPKWIKGHHGYAGHYLIWVSAITFGYGYAANHSSAMILGAGIWGLADYLLVRVEIKSCLAEQVVFRRDDSQTILSDAVKTSELLRVIEQKKKKYPIIGPAIGATEITHRLIIGMKNEKGAGIESLLCALGALAGYSCQANLRVQALEKGLPETAVFTIVETQKGKKYFFGDSLNQLVAVSKISVWNMAASAAERAGCKKLPDIAAIFSHVVESVGDDDFGIPRVPADLRAANTPACYLKEYWPSVLPVLTLFCQSSREWPILFGLAVQDIIDRGKEVIAPEMALRIVMESAVPMSKIDLDTA